MHKFTQESEAKLRIHLEDICDVLGFKDDQKAQLTEHLLQTIDMCHGEVGYLPIALGVRTDELVNLLLAFRQQNGFLR